MWVPSVRPSGQLSNMIMFDEIIELEVVLSYCAEPSQLQSSPAEQLTSDANFHLPFCMLDSFWRNIFQPSIELQEGERVLLLDLKNIKFNNFCQLRPVQFCPSSSRFVHY